MAQLLYNPILEYDVVADGVRVTGFSTADPMLIVQGESARDAAVEYASHIDAPGVIVIAMHYDLSTEVVWEKPYTEGYNDA
jgi:microcompartment protein CcmK/EutM